MASEGLYEQFDERYYSGTTSPQYHAQMFSSAGQFIDRRLNRVLTSEMDTQTYHLSKNKDIVAEVNAI